MPDAISKFNFGGKRHLAFVKNFVFFEAQVLYYELHTSFIPTYF